MEQLLSGLKALAEATRIRILFALSHGEMNVSELVAILGQSQPRVSRHLKLMAEAGLVTRHKEGNWVLFRLQEDGVGAKLVHAIAELVPDGEAILSGDRARIEDVRRQRHELASAYFSVNAAHWQRLRALHVDEGEVETAMLNLVGAAKIDELVDLGTGTGRILELFASQAGRLTGLDLSREMLSIARSTIEQKGLKHAQIRQADIYALPLPDGFANVVTIHQVLHFLDDPHRALMEARRILRPDGRLLIVDFAPHRLEELRESHAHRRLGISTEQMASWLRNANLQCQDHKTLPPKQVASDGLSVSLWLVSPGSATPKSSKTTLTAGHN
jgi:ubiquinone/menaquinone biosynthesis C-methylase UbiE